MRIALLRLTLQEGKLHGFEDDMANDIGKIFKVSLLLNLVILKITVRISVRLVRFPVRLV